MVVVLPTPFTPITISTVGDGKRRSVSFIISTNMSISICLTCLGSPIFFSRASALILSTTIVEVFTPTSASINISSSSS